jgi:hypothetical protein
MSKGVLMKVKLILPYGVEAETTLDSIDGIEEILYEGKLYGIKTIIHPAEGSSEIPVIVVKKKKRDIAFKFEGLRYVVDAEAYDKGKIILPDGRMLEAESWKETDPPEPIGLHEVNHTFLSFEPEKIAQLLDAVLAIEVEVHTSETMQRHHDHYVSLFRQGKLPDKDVPEYELAIKNEEKGEVKPLAEDV